MCKIVFAKIFPSLTPCHNADAHRNIELICRGEIDGIAKIEPNGALSIGE